ncbi:unnamed protein product [[Candida] boidinii]|uniref:Unnamed protein product n=1 Tax=Candida boidinii TaxID=5477 RepID=A0A9W6T5I3_CANBO|nr:unnamed protein product [[Candida] boidinii]
MNIKLLEELPLFPTPPSKLSPSSSSSSPSLDRLNSSNIFSLKMVNKDLKVLTSDTNKEPKQIEPKEYDIARTNAP